MLDQTTLVVILVYKLSGHCARSDAGRDASAEHDSPSKKRRIIGCVDSAQHGMTLTDEKGKRSYSLSGDTTGIQPGGRLTLHGKKIKLNGSNLFVWETKKVINDFGVCQP